MAKPNQEGGEQSRPPESYPNTPPPGASGDLSTWLLNAMSRHTETLGKVEATLTMLQAQMDRMATEVDSIKTEVKGHRNWIHTLKVVLSGLGVIIGWAIVFAVGPWVKTKIFPGR